MDVTAPSFLSYYRVRAVLAQAILAQTSKLGMIGVEHRPKRPKLEVGPAGSRREVGRNDEVVCLKLCSATARLRREGRGAPSDTLFL